MGFLIFRVRKYQINLHFNGYFVSKKIRRTEKLIFVCVSPSYIQVYTAVEPTLSNAEVCFWIAFFWK